MKILNGPGKSDLQTSFFNPKLNFQLDFLIQIESGRLKINRRLKLRITQLKIEDGSGDNFIFHAFNWNTNENYKGFYSVKGRKGFIEKVEV